MATVVLGWDGLDYELCELFDLLEDFGEHHTEIETFDNPIVEKPHTDELWPSIITGLEPKEHGVFAVTDGNTLSWENSIIDTAAKIADGIVPKAVRTIIGRQLLQVGSETNQYGTEYYSDLSTLFDGRCSYPISIPNYRTQRDIDLNLSTDRSITWSEILDVNASGEYYQQKVSRKRQRRVEEWIRGEAMRRVGYIRAAIHYDYDIIFCWFGFLDTVGHISPMIDEAGWQERMYREAAEITQFVYKLLLENDELLCVSDHGLQNGKHTHSAYFGASNNTALQNVDSILDVRNGIEAITDESSHIEPSLREPFKGNYTGENQTAKQVRENLENLGYI